MNHPALADDPAFRAELLTAALNKPSNSDVYTGRDGAVRRHVRPRARRPRAAAPVLHRGRRGGRRERAEGRVRLEVAVERGARARPRTRHPGAAPARGLPRPHRLHDVAHQHRPRQDRPLSRSSTGRASTAPYAARRRPGRRAARRELRRSRQAAGGVRRRTRTTSPASSSSRSRARAATTTSAPEFLQAHAGLCHAHDALFVVDEVQTGCGLTGTAWAYQQLGLQPGRRRVRQEDPGLRRDGRRPGRRGARQRLRRQLADQLHLGRRPHRHGARPAHPRGHGGRRADPPRRRARPTAARDAAQPGRPTIPAITDVARPRPDVRGHPGVPASCATRSSSGCARTSACSLLGCGTRSLRFRPALTVDRAGAGRRCRGPGPGADRAWDGRTR